LRLEQFRVLLVGGGRVGLEKLEAILRNSPATAVTVVAPFLHPELQALAARHPRVRLHARPYTDDDLDAQDFVFVATDDDALNRHIKAVTAERRIFTNVADTPEECDFYLSAAGPRSNPSPAASVAGKSPSMGKRLRAVLEEARPGERHTLLEQMAVMRKRLQGDLRQRLRTLNALTSELAYGPAAAAPATAYWQRVATVALVLFALFLVGTVAASYVTWPQVVQVLQSATTFYTFVAVGFAAQLVDGLLGMGYGVVSAISLMSMGLHPASVSASIHTAEMFASGASGYHHYRFGNVNKKLFRVLLLPGIAGAVSGAYLLSRFGEQYAAWVKPLLAAYLLVLGLRILTRAFRRPDKRGKVKHAGWLAGAGGFLDSFGGGGWGPLVTSTLIANGRTPQYVIGTVSITEFFVTFSSALTFFAMLGIDHWQIILGLIVGGVAAAPLAARLAGRIPTRWMFVGVGLMAIVWSLWALRKLV